MKKNGFIEKISGKLSRAGLKLRKHSPEIFIAVGIAGTVASAVIACRATTKLDDILKETNNSAEKIRERLKDEKLSEKYTDEDGKKDLAITYAQTGIKLAKLYAPAVILGTASISCIIMSHNILRSRNAATAAACAAAIKSFSDYRKRVVERYGEDVDYELFHNIPSDTKAETVTDENGEKITPPIPKHSYSEFARCYDESCSGWVKNSDKNRMFLQGQENYANNLLIARGYLFLNDVYDMLGFPRTSIGQAVGWIYDKNDPTKHNYVDFGIHNTDKEKVRDFINGYENCIWLDFNIDGVIWDLI